jgi:hypothetical protein
MSRTERNHPVWSKCGLRKPRTTNEIRQNEALLADVKADDVPYDISGLNRIHRHIPTAYDDIIISSLSERVTPMQPLELTPSQLYILGNALAYYETFVTKTESTNNTHLQVKHIQSKISNILNKNDINVYISLEELD